MDSLTDGLKDPRRARQAALDLAKMQPDAKRRKEIADLLQNVLVTGGTIDKWSAAEALGIWGSAENVPVLMQQLDGNDVLLKHHVLVALGRLRDPRAVPKMIDAVASPPTRQKAIEGLRYFGAEAEDKLLQRLPNADWLAQRAICDLLKEIGTAKSLSQLNALAQNGSIHVRRNAQTAARAIRRRNP